jgi:hypothetical protein
LKKVIRCAKPWVSENYTVIIQVSHRTGSIFVCSSPYVGNINPA